MFDPQQLLGSLVQDAVLGGMIGGRRRRRRLHRARTGATLGLGLFALIAAAVEHFGSRNDTTAAGSSRPAAPPPPPAARPPVTPPPPPPARGDALAPRDAMLLVRAMISAAAADGAIDDDERRRILDHVARAGGGEDERGRVAAWLDDPPKIADIVREAAGNAALAPQVYAASCLAIDVDTDAERRHLETLAAALGLPGEAIATIHEQLDVPV